MNEPRDFETALRDECCNGCGLPRRLWAPVCGGMTLGDMTHYHSPEFWRHRFTYVVFACDDPEAAWIADQAQTHGRSG